MIITFLNTFVLFFRVASMIQQFVAGMDAFGQLWQTVQRNCINFMPMFTYTHEKLSRSDIRDMFNIRWSPQGCNNREREEDTIFLWECWLMSIESKQYKAFMPNALCCAFKLFVLFSDFHR